ncbi:substrate-binding domain-containing protein [Nostoc sp. FACHB-110]|uniref:substrate-binding domain-containing protein n=1 Tax=Nostoc sp. FACHB-110 TaxID=2692834 RepID=UPI0016827859|nr:substrate-binding domain-containing protein [Nostoc sp. FACHB-110]MBD2440905.1 helix-turn-helix domain-containing protein [Nostoc sp. FACHB-110]
MKLDINICNNIKSIRTRLGMSQQDLANIAGVTRQTISGVESGQYAPSVAITLRLAKALGCQVENLFWLEDDLPEIEAVLAKPVPTGQQLRVSLAKVGGQWIAYPLVGKEAFRMEMIPADGETVAVDGFPGISKLSNPEGKAESQTHTNKVQVSLLDDLDKLQNTVVIAGCTPVISFLARATERWHPQLRVHYHFANSMAALRSLNRGEVHIAGMHLYDPQTGEHNIPFAREVLGGRSAVLITLGIWEEGLVVAPGNPMEIKSLSNLVELEATIINREPGSGSRMLLERKLKEEQVSANAIKGYEHIVHSHQDVALSIAAGIADAGVSTASVAAAFGLGFIPLHQARYDLVILKEYLEEAPVQQFLSILGHRLVQSQLEVLGGYDISDIGEVVATI